MIPYTNFMFLTLNYFFQASREKQLLVLLVEKLYSRYLFVLHHNDNACYYMFCYYILCGNSKNLYSILQQNNFPSKSAPPISLKIQCRHFLLGLWSNRSALPLPIKKRLVKPKIKFVLNLLSLRYEDILKYLHMGDPYIYSQQKRKIHTVICWILHCLTKL